ncbi:MAG: hypothetical protein LUD29_01300 [Clostridia bacterium]|nr:hypothetical protein [Clostridia bacterium]
MASQEQKNLDLYLRAAANFYGFIKPGKFLSLYNKYNSVKLLKEDFLDLMYDYGPGRKHYKVYNNAIVNTQVSEEKISEIADAQEGKPFKTLTKDQFLPWADDDYFPYTPVCQYFTEYLTVKQGLDAAKAYEITKSVYHNAMRGNDKMTYLSKIMTDAGVFNFDDLDEAQAFINVFMKFLNSGIPRWSNCGYTPEELFVITEKRPFPTLPN